MVADLTEMLNVTGFQEKFILSYFKFNFNGTEAIKDAGYTGKWAGQAAYELLNTPKVKAEVERMRKELVGEAKLEVADVVNGIKDILTADPRELTEYRRCSCRYCHGMMFLYQYTPQEWRDAYASHIKSADYLERGVPFDPKGGEGYNPTRDPHPNCPECFGQGVGRAFFHDTRNLSPAAAALYAGVKETSSGTEVIMQSVEKAREQAARYLGMHKIDLNVTNNTKANEISNDELARIANDESKK